MLVSIFGRYFGYPDQDFRGLPQSMQTSAAAFQTLSNSSFIKHPIIRLCIIQKLWSKPQENKSNIPKYSSKQRGSVWTESRSLIWRCSRDETIRYSEEDNIATHDMSNPRGFFKWPSSGVRSPRRFCCLNNRSRHYFPSTFLCAFSYFPLVLDFLPVIISQNAEPEN
jgi:hypothetical protein